MKGKLPDAYGTAAIYALANELRNGTITVEDDE